MAMDNANGDRGIEDSDFLEFDESDSMMMEDLTAGDEGERDTAMRAEKANPLKDL